MADRQPLIVEGLTETVVVSLSQIPVELREQVAARLVAAWERHGVHPSEWLEVRLAALTGIPDAKLEVPRWKADLVLAGRQPIGDTPKELLW